MNLSPSKLIAIGIEIERLSPTHKFTLNKKGDIQIDSDPQCVLTFSHDEYRKKIYINGRAPTAVDGQIYGLGELSSISVSETRPAKEIAKDTCRRFLTKYLNAYKESKERCEAHNNVAANQEKLAEEIIAIVGGTYDMSCTRVRPGRLDIEQGYFFRDIYIGDGTVEIDLRSVPAETAKSMLRIFMAGQTRKEN